MAQLSRPYQIALAAVVMLALVWVVALRAHGSNPSEPLPASLSPSTPAGGSAGSASSPSAGRSSGSPAATSASNAAAQAKAPSAPTPIYHGAAPGVEGLTRAIAKAHGAVATSQQNAQQLQRKSGEASNEPRATATAGSTLATGAASRHKPAAGATPAHRTTSHATRGRAGSSAAASGHRAAQQVAVERELSRGKTVMLVFGTSNSTVDVSVLAQAKALASLSKGAVTVHAARASQVGMFGSITEVAHVYQTPTILIVNRHGVVSTLTGLTDVFALQQAVREAVHAGR
jgi:hypothetical protein